jgi:hypothetical protein
MGADRAVRRLDADSAERVLAGEDVGFVERSALLAAAAAPARRHETAGETAAVVAFRHAALGATTGRQRQRSTARARWARLASVKAAAVALALTTAGVALAAGTGVLPTPFIPGSSTASPSAAGGPGDLGPDRDRRTSSSAHPTDGTTAPPTSTPTATADPELVRQCRTYQDQAAKKGSDRALKGREFRKLIEAAGGRDKVDGYCLGLVGPPTTPHPPPGRPGTTGNPETRTGPAPPNG